MALSWWDIQEARREAQETIRTADAATRMAARLAAGRLRIAEVDTDVLRKLKRELQDFNAATGEWRE